MNDEAQVYIHEGDDTRGARVTTRFNGEEISAVDRAAAGEDRGKFVKRVVLEAAQGLEPASGPGARPAPASPRAPRRKASAGRSGKVRGGRPPSPAAGPATRGVAPDPPIEGQVVREQLGDVVAGISGSASLALRALRLGQVTVDGVVVRNPERHVVADQVAVSGAG